MDFKLALLLAFIAGGVSVWALMKTSGRVSGEWIDEIKAHVAALGGVVTDIDMVPAKDCPFSAEYRAPGFAYKFYKVAYLDGDAPRTLWAVLEMKHRSYGPAGAIVSNRVWRS